MLNMVYIWVTGGTRGLQCGVWPIRYLLMTEAYIRLRTAGYSRFFTAIRKDAGLCCGSRLRKGKVFAYVGLP